MPTAADPKVAIDGVIERIQRLLRSCRGKKVEGIGISLPGRVEPWLRPPGVRAQS